MAREEDSPNESTPVSKRFRRRKTFKTSDDMDTDADPSDMDYVIGQASEEDESLLEADFKQIGYRSHTDDVKDIIRQYHPVCVALQETFLKSCHTTKIRRALPFRNSLQAVAVRIHSTSLITVYCLYLPPNAVNHQQDLNNLVDQFPAPFVILGDFNGHSTMWGSVKTKPRSRQIEQVLSDHCLCLLNHEEPTTYIIATHFPVVLSHDYDASGKTFPSTYSYNRADWALFTQLAVISDAMVKTESVDTAVQEVTNVLIAAADLSIPKNSSHSFQRYKPWWNADCQTAYKNQRNLWGIFHRFPTTENILALKKGKSKCSQSKASESRKSWFRYVSSLTSSTSSKQLWRKVKAANCIYRKLSFPILQTSDSAFSSPVEIATTLGETFQSVFSTASYNSRFLEIKRRAESTPINFSTRSFFPYNCDFTMTELKKALLQAHNTSPGPDGITSRCCVI
ncbi:putative RNA-directed DNA polymerase from transposon X-element [Trichonephila clavipes]|nr:putative RNA-directed DNA polymerase from transposon X-element [Trichonephila clavipes]